MGGAIEGADGLLRCPWGISTPDYIAYHDNEWGRPVIDDNRLYEKICLEGFQSGLSWLTILRKRDGFRAAFAGFDPERVARFGPDDVERLVTDPSIVRHRGKITAAINNATAVLRTQAEYGSLASFVWSFEPGRADRCPPGELTDIAASTPESVALSKALRRLGFRFVGPTTMYAAMQSLGLVNDHLACCHVREACEAERCAFNPCRG